MRLVKVLLIITLLSWQEPLKNFSLAHIFQWLGFVVVPALFLFDVIRDVLGGIANMLPAEIMDGEDQDNDDADGI